MCLRDWCSGDDEGDVVLKGGVVVARMEDDPLDVIVFLVGVLRADVVLSHVRPPSVQVKVEDVIAGAERISTLLGQPII